MYFFPVNQQFGNLSEICQFNTQNAKTCLAEQDQAGSYMWVIVINNLIKECNFEIENLSIMST